MGQRRFQASGIQIAFIIFAVVFLGSPAEKYLAPWLFPGGIAPQFGRLFFFVPAIALLLLVPPLRSYCRRELAIPIGPPNRLEVGIVAAADALVPFAIAGGLVLWYWILGGEMALASRLGREETAAAAMEGALSMSGLLFLALMVFVAPCVEELVFRGMLFRAWASEWGWFKALIASSAIFALYHPIPIAAFIGATIYCVLYRRTGSIRAPILAHMLHNAMLWYPLMGQFYFRTAGKETGEIELWTWHLLALGILAVALPIYVWMARDPKEETEAVDEGCAVRS